jgi:hypothetical protein
MLLFDGHFAGIGFRWGAVDRGVLKGVEMNLSGWGQQVDCLEMGRFLD